MRLWKKLSAPVLALALLCGSAAAPSGASTTTNAHHAVVQHAKKKPVVKHGPAPLPYGITPAEFQMVFNVHHCEENVPNGWAVNGPKYQGGLGWLHATWLRWKAPSFPNNMAFATPYQQAWAMLHFIPGANGGYWPDQPYGNCTGGY